MNNNKYIEVLEQENEVAKEIILAIDSYTGIVNLEREKLSYLIGKFEAFQLLIALEKVLKNNEEVWKRLADL